MGSSTHYLFFTILFHSCVYFAWSQPVWQGNPILRNYSPIEYNGGMQNWKIMQDNRGVMYIANNNGLLEYDGTSWRLHPVKNNAIVRSVTSTQQGKIYVACPGEIGYFMADIKGEIAYHSLVDFLPEQEQKFDEVWSVYSLNNKVYFCSFEELFIFHETTQTFTIIRPPDNRLAYSFLLNDEVFVQLYNGAVYVVYDELEKIEGTDFLKDKEVKALIPLSKEKVLVITDMKGAYIWHNENITSWPHPSIFENKFINCAIKLRNGLIAIGTQGKGIIIFNEEGTVLQHVDKKNGLPSNTVRSLFEDVEGNVWIGLNNGISRFKPDFPFTLLNEYLGVTGAGYASTIFEGKLFLGTNTGLFSASLTNKKDNGYTLLENTEGQVYSLQVYNDILVAGHHKGVFHISDEFTDLYHTNGALYFTRYPYNPDYYFFGSYDGLWLAHYEDKNWKVKYKYKGFDEPINSLGFTGDSVLWVSSNYNDFTKISLPKNPQAKVTLENISEYKGYIVDKKSKIFHINQHIFITLNNGVYRYDSKTDILYPMEELNKLLGNNFGLIREMEEDIQGNLYLLSKNKFAKVIKSESGYSRIDTNTFKHIQYLLNDDVENISALNDQNVLIGAKDGFIHYNPSIKISNDKSPLPLFREVKINSDYDSVIFSGMFMEDDKIMSEQPVTRNPIIPYNKNSLSFTYALPSYSEQKQYANYLEGFENSWSEWSVKNEKEYTNLPPGHYSFHVKAITSQGVESPVATYKFTIQTPWYRHISTYLFTSFTLILVIVLVIYRLIKNYKKKAALLSESHAQFLQEKNHQIETITLQSVKSIEHLNTQRLEAEILHYTRELGSSIMHIIKTNNFLNSLKKEVSTLSKKNVSESTKSTLDQIINTIEKNLLEEEDEQYNFLFNQVHGDFTKRLQEAHPSLTAQDIKLCSYLRMNMTTKEIADLLNITVRSAELSRYRLRKKLQLDREVNLAEYILKF
ncbi:MAG: hypothetical protein OEY51_00350 [Cyclobacteriaceae bacterium]|nr:hypothetical protein [Cyclobacteriaceae bacterium]